MATTLEDFKLDPENDEFNFAIDIVNHTNKIIYLTGKAGTGKTTFLKYLNSVTNKETVILAPTGVAAINAGGQTINSFFQIPFGPFVPNDRRLRTSKDLGDLNDATIYNTFQYNENKRSIIENLELLIIDEISMVRCDVLDVIDRILRVFRKKIFLPFGGVQVVLIGDTFQLPPIAIPNEWEILKEHYQSRFFFSSRVIRENKPIYIELKKIYRQKEQEFIDLLNKVRVNQVDENDLRLLNSKFNPTFSTNDTSNYIILATSNAQVDQTNLSKLNELKKTLHVFNGELSGVFPKDNKGNFVLPTEQSLHLKEGAQVMFLKNDTGEFKKYYNGKIGTISNLSEENIFVEFPDSTKVQVEKASWNNIQYTWNREKQIIEEKILGTFIQYPLRLAWAITVHKSQGLTFEKVYADLGSAFEDGQIYVALSRCTSFSGLFLKSLIHKSRITTNKDVVDFAKTETPSTLIIEELNTGKANSYYKEAREKLKKGQWENAYNAFLKAIKFRNDIETALFKRYILNIGLKNTRYKNHSEAQAKEIQSLFNSKHSLEIMSKLFIEDNSELKKSNNELQIKINNNDETIRLLNEDKKKHDKQQKASNEEIELLLTEFNSLQDEIKDLKEKLIFKTQEVESKNKIIQKKIGDIDVAEKQANKRLQQIDTLNETIEKHTKELSDIYSLKWYQRIFGLPKQ